MTGIVEKTLPDTLQTRPTRARFCGAFRLYKTPLLIPDHHSSIPLLQQPRDLRTGIWPPSRGLFKATSSGRGFFTNYSPQQRPFRDPWCGNRCCTAGHGEQRVTAFRSYSDTVLSSVELCCVLPDILEISVLPVPSRIAARTFGRLSG